MDFISKFVETVGGYFQTFMDWLHTATIDVCTYYILVTVKLTYESSIYALGIAMSVASNVIQELQFNEYLNSYYNQLPDQALQLCNFLALPQAVNSILSALLLRFIMGKLSFLG